VLREVDLGGDAASTAPPVDQGQQVPRPVGQRDGGRVPGARVHRLRRRPRGALAARAGHLEQHRHGVDPDAAGYVGPENVRLGQTELAVAPRDQLGDHLHDLAPQRGGEVVVLEQPSLHRREPERSPRVLLGLGREDLLHFSHRQEVHAHHHLAQVHARLQARVLDASVLEIDPGDGVPAADLEHAGLAPRDHDLEHVRQGDVPETALDHVFSLHPPPGPRR
jgi:hypothetical protein